VKNDEQRLLISRFLHEKNEKGPIIVQLKKKSDKNDIFKYFRSLLGEYTHTPSKPNFEYWNELSSVIKEKRYEDKLVGYSGFESGFLSYQEIKNSFQDFHISETTIDYLIQRLF